VPAIAFGPSTVGADGIPPSGSLLGFLLSQQHLAAFAYAFHEKSEPLVVEAVALFLFDPIPQLPPVADEGLVADINELIVCVGRQAREFEKRNIVAGQGLDDRG